MQFQTLCGSPYKKQVRSGQTLEIKTWDTDCISSTRCMATQQDRKNNNNITLRPVRVTIVAAEKKKVLHILGVCVCMYLCLSYPAKETHLFCAILYCHLWPVWLYHIFPLYLINGTILGGGVLLNIKFWFWYSLQILCEAFPILRRIRRDIINLHTSSYQVPFTLATF